MAFASPRPPHGAPHLARGPTPRGHLRQPLLQAGRGAPVRRLRGAAALDGTHAPSPGLRLVPRDSGQRSLLLGPRLPSPFRLPEPPPHRPLQRLPPRRGRPPLLPRLRLPPVEALDAVDRAVVRSGGVLPGGAVVHVGVREESGWRWRGGERGGADVVACHGFGQSVLGIDRSLGFPAFFSHLLGKCLKRKYPILEIMKLAFVVLAKFALTWWPYLHSLEAVLQVLSPLAPFERGIYEDYVANFWCSTSVLIKWRRLFAIKPLKLMSLSMTILAFLPSFVQQVKSPSNLGFLYSLLNSSFSFYLFFYQVHEKSILLPLLLASLLTVQEPQLYGWFMYYALFSMYPLICRDQLPLQYIAVLGLFFHIYHSPCGN